MSRGLVFRRRLPERFGRAPLYVTPDAGLRFWRPGLDHADSELFNAVAELVHPGTVAWDIGANVGLFSFAAAALAQETGYVLVIEPDMWLAGLLRRSARLPAGNRAPVEVLGVAIDQSVGVARLHVAARARASNSLSPDRARDGTAGGTREIQLVPTVTLDWLLEHFRPPTVVKIDVEGLEDRVLAGGARLLREARPAIFCEVASEKAAEVAAIFANANYRMFNPNTRPADRVPLALPVWNTLALPAP